MSQQQTSVEEMLDQLGAELTQAYGGIIARQASRLVVANAHIVNLQARLGQAEAALVEMQNSSEESTDGSDFANT